MPRKAFVIRFPDGSFEYDLSRRPMPTIGDTIRRRGAVWSVTKVTRGDTQTVHVANTENPSRK